MQNDRAIVHYAPSEHEVARVDAPFAEALAPEPVSATGSNLGSNLRETQPAPEALSPVNPGTPK